MNVIFPWFPPLPFHIFSTTVPHLIPACIFVTSFHRCLPTTANKLFSSAYYWHFIFFQCLWSIFALTAYIPTFSLDTIQASSRILPRIYCTHPQRRILELDSDNEHTCTMGHCKAFDGRVVYTVGFSDRFPRARGLLGIMCPAGTPENRWKNQKDESPRLSKVFQYP